MRNILKNKKGFTLTELMIVVVILGILTAIAVPLFGDVTTDAAQNACDANVKTIQSAVNMFAASEAVPSDGIDGVITPAADGTFVLAPAASASATFTATALADFLGAVEPCGVSGHATKTYTITDGVVASH